MPEPFLISDNNIIDSASFFLYTSFFQHDDCLHMISLEKWVNTFVIVGSISVVTSGNFSEIGKTKLNVLPIQSINLPALHKKITMFKIVKKKNAQLHGSYNKCNYH